MRGMSRTWSPFVATLVVVVAITFPWDLQDHPHWSKVAWLPFLSGIVRPVDILTNAALYFPVGFFLPAPSRRRRVAWAFGIALLVSGPLELTQVWSHVRFPSATDLAMNVIGSVVGAIVSARDVPPT